ncbi:vegetative cell wall protein gp1-like [Mesocricetus auratus]|uniref:Vegetative cell wall protein gp1-like n=1 Tax=Mesocricetus auratus TaxID=10036 RepID=A0ABM2WM17_MESAU|nr:vegetative cell wall protein gp1-like [Mesocricetus auratus]
MGGGKAQQHFTSLTQPWVPSPHQNLVPPAAPPTPAPTPPAAHATFHPPAPLRPRPTLAPILPAHSRTEIPSRPPPSDSSAPPTPALPRLPLASPAPCPGGSARGGACPPAPLSPAPDRHAEGQPDPGRPRGDPRAEACGRGVAGPRQAPRQSPARPVSSPWGRAGWVTDLAARRHHRACRGRCRCRGAKARLTPGGGGAAAPAAAAAAAARDALWLKSETKACQLDSGGLHPTLLRTCDQLHCSLQAVSSPPTLSDRDLEGLFHI